MSSTDPTLFLDAGGDGDRLAIRRNDTAWLDGAFAAADTLFVPIVGEDNLLDAAGMPFFPDAPTAAALRAQAESCTFLGEWRGRICFALGLSENAPLPVGAQRSNLRAQFALLDCATLALLGYARAMAHWHTHSRYCGKCGARTESRRAGHERHCPRCGNIIYPRVNPAVIVLVTHGECCLLGRQPGWADNRFSTLAGFVEPGENLEAALKREVREETNIRVRALRYVFSQPWPYPAALMLGFNAEAENTDIRCNDGELADARWFSRQDIAAGLRAGTLSLSVPGSSSYLLIRNWFDAHAATPLDALVRP